MKLNDIVRSTFLPPSGLKNKYGYITSYGIEKDFDKFFAFICLNNYKSYARDGAIAFGDDKVSFNSIGEAIRRCWENFDFYYSSFYEKEYSALGSNSAVDSP